MHPTASALPAALAGHEARVRPAVRGLRWHVIGCAVWFTWVAALGLTLARLGHEGRRRFALPLALLTIVLIAGEAALLTWPLRWDRVLALRLAWSALGGLGCALVLGPAPATVLLAERFRVARASWLRSWRQGIGCGALFALVVLGDAVLVSVIWRAIDPATRTVLAPAVLLWTAPGFLLGAVLHLVWIVRGAAPTRAVANLFVGMHLFALAVLVLGALDAWLTTSLAPAEPFDIVGNVAGQVWIAGAVLVAPIPIFAAYVGLAPSGTRALGRTVVAIGLTAGTFAQLALWSLPGVWHRSAALRDERAADPADRRRALASWEAYLTAFPETDERGEALWRLAASHAALGEHAAAAHAYERLAALPPDVPGQRFARRSRLVLEGRATTAAPRIDTALVPAIPPASYLNPPWRSVLAFLASAPSPGRDALLVGLRKVSLTADRLVLPALTNLFEAKAYARLLGVDVRIASLAIDDVRARLAAGDAVLVESRGRWLVLVGVDPTWGTFQYLNYDRETPAVRRRELEARARTLASEPGATPDTRLRDEIVDDMAVGEVAALLAGRHGLVALLGTDDGRTPWDRFLIGELAMDAGDPTAALGHYARVAAEPNTDWVLPYVHVAARTADRPLAEIVERRIVSRPDRDAFEAWRRMPTHAALLRRAALAFEALPLASLPTPVLERLGGLLDARERAHADTRVALYETLSARDPEDVAFVNGLVETHLAANDVVGLAADYRRLATLQWGDSAPRLHLADALLRLGRADDAWAELAFLRERFMHLDVAAETMALEGRTALALGEPERAAVLLERVLADRPSDPRSRAALARALEATGRADEALVQWRWVDWTGVDADDVATARARVAAVPDGEDVER